MVQVKNTYTGPGLVPNSHTSTIVHKLYIIPVAGEQCYFLTFEGSRHTHGSRTYMQGNTHTNKINKPKKILKIDWFFWFVCGFVVVFFLDSLIMELQHLTFLYLERGLTFSSGWLCTQSYSSCLGLSMAEFLLKFKL